MRLQQAGENSLILYLGEDVSDAVAAQVRAATAAVETVLEGDLIDLIPSYASLLIIYDALRTDHFSVATRVSAILPTLSAERPESLREVVLPVYYALEVGEDLDRLAAQTGLSIDAIIELHSATAYRVYAIGFAPGFAYLGEVDPRIAAPRLATPRLRVPRGAVAIADRQTAVYPAVSPGGWNLIGRCPTRMFDPDARPTMPVGVGDRVRFEPIDRQRFLALGGDLG